MAVVIDAIERMLWARAGSHVDEKMLEGFPAFAHTDPAAAVMRKALVGGVKAALTHLGPGPMLRSTCPTMPQVW